MIPGKAKHIIKARISRYDSKYTSGDDSFTGILSKSDVARDLPRAEYTIHIAHDADVNNGEIITDPVNNQKYVPLMIETPNLVNGNLLKKVYLRQANASGSIKTFVDVSSASLDEWGEPEGTEGSDWGWIAQKHSVWANFERLSLKGEMVDIGAIEKAVFQISVPWSMNASHTPIAENRFTTTAGIDWKIEDVDAYTHQNQAYILRISRDDR